MDLREVGRFLLQQPLLILLMAQGVSIFVLVRICQINLFQPILESKGIPVSSHGLWMSVTSIFEAVGAARPGWIRRWLSDLNAVFVLTVVMALSFSAMAWSGSVTVLIWMSVFALVTGFSFPIQRQVLNDAIPATGYRATLLSLESILDRAVCAVVAASLGGFLGRGELRLFLHLSGGVSLLLMIVLYTAMRRSRPVLVPSGP